MLIKTEGRWNNRKKAWEKINSYGDEHIPDYWGPVGDFQLDFSLYDPTYVQEEVGRILRQRLRDIRAVYTRYRSMPDLTYLTPFQDFILTDPEFCEQSPQCKLITVKR